MRLAGGDQTERHAPSLFAARSVTERGGARRTRHARRSTSVGGVRSARACPGERVAQTGNRAAGRRGAAASRPALDSSARRLWRSRPDFFAGSIATTLQFVVDRGCHRLNVFELLGLAGLQLDRLALRRARQAVPVAVRDRFADERERRALPPSTRRGTRSAAASKTGSGCCSLSSSYGFSESFGAGVPGAATPSRIETG